MLARTLIRIHRLALLVTLAVALVATGFAHSVPTPQDEALAFALANGVPLSDFCASDLDGDLGGAGHRVGHCPACQIAGTADLPPVILTQLDLELAFLADIVFPRESRAKARALDPARSPQGPPVA